jgi:hypothetical protein
MTDDIEHTISYSRFYFPSQLFLLRLHDRVNRAGNARIDITWDCGKSLHENYGMDFYDLHTGVLLILPIEMPSSIEVPGSE